MIIYLNCPECQRPVRLEVYGQLITESFEIYKEQKCNHCSKYFIYKLRLDADSFSKPQ